MRRRKSRAKEMNVNFFFGVGEVVGNKVLKIFHLAIFSKKAIFSEKIAKTDFLRRVHTVHTLFGGSGRLKLKIRIETLMHT